AQAAEPLTRAQISDHIMPPFSLGEPVNDRGVWGLLNSGGAEAGYVFETEPMAPLPGFSGAPINMLVILDLEGRFMDVRLIAHNEPIFVSGLGQAPFHKFFEQYRGHSISSSLVVGTPYGDGGDGSSLVYLDGVTKATASVRIAHESVLAATLQVAREKMQGISTGPPAHPDLEHTEDLTWADLVTQGLATRHTMTNAQIEDAFAGTLWEGDDPEALDYPEETYLDLWIVDLGPPSIAQAVLSKDGYRDLQSFLEISTYDEPILVIETGRHGLVSEEFVRNTAPDWLSAEQDGLPVALRDADLFVELQNDVPDGAAMILRTDRRLGFDPSRPWTLNVQAVREHGMFQPEIGNVVIPVEHVTDERFFSRPEVIKPVPPWLEALRNRQTDMAVLGAGLAGLVVVLGFGQSRLAGLRWFTPVRLVVLAGVLGFVGWWGQGQLSIVTVLGVIRTAFEGGSFAFLLYDPFSLLIWAVVIVGFVLWG
ncbi:MAG: 4Fe-4S binding protein, partial [Pseudomonadota bacterium]